MKKILIRQEKKINNLVSSVIFAISGGRVPVREFSDSPLFQNNNNNNNNKKVRKEKEKEEEKKMKRDNCLIPVLIN